MCSGGLENVLSEYGGIVVGAEQSVKAQLRT